ncbi:MAG TPA: HU family DNA-binding protein [Bryobacteraceae bacterium]|nr:HU family DNA-binding protein [Bryobacteraceae bacterium]
MKKQDITERLARKARLPRAVAADRLDRLIHDILAELKRGHPVSLPGLGTFTPGKKVNFQFDMTKPKEANRRAGKH